MERVPSEEATIACKAFGLPEATPVYYSDAQYFLAINEEDEREGKPLDIAACAGVHSYRRTTGRDGRILHRTAYLVQPDKKGEDVIVKYAKSAQLNQGTDGYDKTGKFPSQGLYLLPIPPSWRKENINKMREARAKKITIEGYQPRPYKRTGAHKEERALRVKRLQAEA